MLATDRVAHLEALSLSVLNHAGRLREAGRADEALATAEEGLGLCREFAGLNPEAGLTVLVATLLLVSDWRSPPDGLAEAEEAVGLARARRPEVLPEALRHLAAVLNRAGTKAGRRRARALTEEATAREHEAGK